MVDIELYDYNGNALDRLYQWDCNITIKINGAPTTPLPVCHFADKEKCIAYVVPCETDGDKLVTKVPNIILQQPTFIAAYVVYSQPIGDDRNESRTKFDFRIPVFPRAMPEEYTYTENIDYVNWVELSEQAQELINQAAQAIADTQAATIAANTATEKANEISNFYGSPLTALTASAMTHTDRIYVYCGNETGYVYGNWYYHNGTAWVSGGTYNSNVIDGVIMTDTTENKTYKLYLKLVDGEPVIDGVLVE